MYVCVITIKKFFAVLSSSSWSAIKLTHKLLFLFKHFEACISCQLHFNFFKHHRVCVAIEMRWCWMMKPSKMFECIDTKQSAFINKTQVFFYFSRAAVNILTAPNQPQTAKCDGFWTFFSSSSQPVYELMICYVATIAIIDFA